MSDQVANGDCIIFSMSFQPFYIIMVVVVTHQNNFNGVVLMSTHSVHFHDKVRKFY